jgi:hypothetical protein
MKEDFYFSKEYELLQYLEAENEGYWADKIIGAFLSGEYDHYCFNLSSKQ